MYANILHVDHRHFYTDNSERSPEAYIKHINKILKIKL